MLMSRTSVHLVFFCLLGSALFAQSANISGTLKTEDGKQVTSTVRLRSAGDPRMLPLSVTPPPSGAFSFTSVLPGSYEICASVAGETHTDPCMWNGSGLPVTVKAGQSVTGADLTLKKSSTLKVHINDPGQFVKDTPQGALLMGVVAPNGQFRPAIRTNTSGNGRDYQIQVPFDTPFYFNIVPIGLTVADPNNNPIQDRQAIPQLHHEQRSHPHGTYLHRERQEVTPNAPAHPCPAWPAAGRPGSTRGVRATYL